MDKHASPGPRRYAVAPLLPLLVALPTLRALGTLGVRPLATWRGGARRGLALMYAFTASAHFTRRRTDLVRMMPPCVAALRPVVAPFPANAPAARRGVTLVGESATPPGFRTLVQGLLIALTLRASDALPGSRASPQAIRQMSPSSWRQRFPPSIHPMRRAARAYGVRGGRRHRGSAGGGRGWQWQGPAEGVIGVVGPGESARVSRSGGPGVEDGLAALFSRYESRIYAFIYYATGDADNAAELTRETFLRAYLELGEAAIGDGAELKTDAWLHRLAADACLGTGRRLRTRWGPLARRRAAATRDHSAPRAALDRLPPRRRLALLLREYAGLSCADIGAVLDISGEAARALLFRAREEFRAARVDYGAGSCPPRQPRSAPTRQGGSFEEEISAR